MLPKRGVLGGHLKENIRVTITKLIYMFVLPLGSSYTSRSEGILRQQKDCFTGYLLLYYLTHKQLTLRG